MYRLPKCVPREPHKPEDTRENLLTMSETASFIGRNLVTLYRWYDWYHDSRYEKPVTIPSLPAILQAGRGKPLYIRKSELTKLLRFKTYVKNFRPMGEYNMRFLSKAKQAQLKPETWARKKPPKYIRAEDYYMKLAEEARAERLAREEAQAKRKENKENSKNNA